MPEVMGPENRRESFDNLDPWLELGMLLSEAAPLSKLVVKAPDLGEKDGLHVTDHLDSVLVINAANPGSERV